MFDPASLGSFCSVSNLPFLGKVMEIVVTRQLQRTLDEGSFSQGSDLGLGLS